MKFSLVAFTLLLLRSWLWDMDENPLIGKLSKRVEELTGLDTTYSPLLSRAEPFQVGKMNHRKTLFHLVEKLRKKPSCVCFLLTSH